MAVAQCYKLFTLFTLFSLFIPFKLLYTAQTIAFMIGPFSSCEIGKTRGTNKQVNKQTNKEIAIANSTASFFLPVSNIDLKLLLVPPAQQRLNISD